MKHSQILATITLLFTAATASANVTEIKSMREILPFVDSQTLLVFDLDNTVMEPLQTLGSDQWFKYLLSQGQTLSEALSVWEEVQKVTAMRPVETITPEIIADEQNLGVQVMALTARPADLAETTENQLMSIGVSFQKESPNSHGWTGTGENAATYIHGIEYIGPSLSKGDALMSFLNSNGLHPSRVVFVDDTSKHDETVNVALDHAKIENYEFRYGADDAKVAAFDAQIAAIELEVFKNSGGLLISDSQARALRQHFYAEIFP